MFTLHRFSVSEILILNSYALNNSRTKQSESKIKIVSEVSTLNNNTAEKSTEREKERNNGTEAKTEKAVSRKEVDDLKSNVEKLSNELNTAVVDLNKSVVDIRSAVSEIENPFNLLRVIQSEKDLKKLNNQRTPHGVRSINIGKPGTSALQEEEPEEKMPEEKKPEEKPVHFEEETSPEPQLETKPVIEEPPPQFQTRLKNGASDCLDWVWSHLNSGLTPDDILELAKSYEFLGYLPEKSSDYIYSLALAAEKMKSVGYKKNHMLLSMYRAAHISGIQIGIADVDEVISIAESKVRRNRPSIGPRDK
jgi:hypothetical protein